MEAFQPNVVAILVSPFDVPPRQIAQGPDDNVFQAWESDYRKALQDAIDELSAGGASVVLLTVPYFISGELDTTNQIDHLQRRSRRRSAHAPLRKR